MRGKGLSSWVFSISVGSNSGGKGEYNVSVSRTNWNCTCVERRNHPNGLYIFSKSASEMRQYNHAPRESQMCSMCSMNSLWLTGEKMATCILVVENNPNFKFSYLQTLFFWCGAVFLHKLKSQYIYFGWLNLQKRTKVRPMRTSLAAHGAGEEMSQLVFCPKFKNHKCYPWKCSPRGKCFACTLSLISCYRLIFSPTNIK